MHIYVEGIGSVNRCTTRLAMQLTRFMHNAPIALCPQRHPPVRGNIWRSPCIMRAAAGGRRPPRTSERPAESRPAQPRSPTAEAAQGPRRNKLDIWKNQLARLSGNPRAVAVAQLIRIEEEGAFVGLVGGSPGAAGAGGSSSSEDDPEGTIVPGRSWRDKLSDRDARLTTELVAGVTRWRRRLDYIISQLTNSKDLNQLDSPLRQILRMGLYELLELGTPPHVMNEHVQLAKRVINTGAGGFANGVLRSAIRLKEAHQLPHPPAPPPGADKSVVADALGTAASHPTWLVERWLRQFGSRHTLDLLKWNNARPTHSLRLSPALGIAPAQLCAQLAKSGVVALPSRYLPHEYVRVESGLQALLSTGLLAEGMVQVQDEAAGLVVAMLDPQPGESILDACAAPGGKTLFAAARMGGRGRILAVDISGPRLRALAAAAQRQGYGGLVSTMTTDLTRLPGPGGGAPRAAGMGGHQSQQQAGQQHGQDNGDPAAVAGASGGSGGSREQCQLLWEQFDRVLLDAPCSGTGVLSKRADLRWRRGPSSLRQLIQLQDALLHAAAQWVKPGGLLVYSTCSLEPEENSERIARFLAAHPEFVAEPAPCALALPPDCLTPEGFLQMLPYVHATDGAFAARLRRRQE